MPRHRRLVDLDLPEALVLEVFGHLHGAGLQRPFAEFGFDVGDLAVRQIQLGADDGRRLPLVPAAVADVALAGVVAQVEVAVGAVHRVQPAKRLQERGFARFVLADHAGHVVQRNPAGIVYASVVGDPRSRNLHAAS